MIAEDSKKTPVMISIEGKKTTYQRTIANKYGKHLINKLNNLIKDIPDENRWQ